MAIGRRVTWVRSANTPAVWVPSSPGNLYGHFDALYSPFTAAAPTLSAVSAISTDTNSTNATGSVPGSPAARDVVVAHVVVVGGASTITPPAGQGWTLVQKSVSGSSTAICAVYIKQWGVGFTDSTSPAFTGTGGNMRVVCSLLTGIPGVVAGLWSAASGSGTTGTAQTAPDSAGGTNKFVMRFFAGNTAGAGQTTADTNPQYGGASYSFQSGVDGSCAMSAVASSSDPVGTAGATSNSSSEWATVTMVLSGSRVIQWDDISGNAQHMTNSFGGGSEPVYDPTVWNGLMPSMMFNGSRFMQRTSGILSTIPTGTNTPWSMMAVCQATSNANYRVIGAWDDGAGTQTYSAGINPSKKIYNNDGVNLPAGANNVDGTRQTLVWSAGGGTTDMWAKTTQEVTGGTLGNVNTSSRFLCFLHPLGGFGWDGLVSELCVYASKLRPTDYSSFYTYAAAKWGGL